MAEPLRPDICVIGAGSGGLSVAAAAAAFHVPTVLIEKGRMGGDCLNTGCVPSKALIAAARHAESARRAPRFGVRTGEPAVDFAAVRAHVRGVIDSIAPNDSEERFTKLGVTVIRAAARFRDPGIVVAGGAEIKARRFVLATGSGPAVPPIPGLAETPYLTNETVFENAELPEHLVVIGGGPIGMEMAQAHRRLGARVTVLEALGTVLARDDPEAAAIVRDAFAREGIAVRTGVKIEAVEPGPPIVVRLAGGEGIACSHLFLATGRRAVTENLGLDEAGIAHDAKGIKVDASLRTSNKRVYAVGDVAGGPQFTHVANYQAGLVIRSILFRLPVRVDYDSMPWVTYTDPELAQIGLDEARARARRRDIRVLRWPYAENDRAHTERETAGFIKVIATARGRILGATIVGAQAGEMANLWSLALARGLGMRALAGFVSPYPTLGELGKRAATSFFTPRLTGPWVRRTVEFMRVFG